MRQPDGRSFTAVLLTAFVVGCCAVVAQSQRKEQKLDPGVLADAPVVPQMVADSDGTLHFGPRTVPPPALESTEARRSGSLPGFAPRPDRPALPTSGPVGASAAHRK